MKNKMLRQAQVLHYPTLRTVLIVENVLREADTVISKAELERKLPKQIMHQTLKLILEYLNIDKQHMEFV